MQGGLINNLFNNRTALMLAPMARTTDSAFRRICCQHGCDLVFTEMATAEGILEDSSMMYRLVTYHPDERPAAIQLTGSSAYHISKAIKRLVKSHRPALIDLNAGCPVPNICSRGCGAALLGNQNKLSEIVDAAVTAAGDTPVSVKIRATGQGAKLQPADVGRIVEDAGAKFITVHARLRTDSYSTSANWDYIAAVKQAIDIPVVGNGDVFAPPDALAMHEHTNADGIMVARGALGRPWMFNQCRALLNGQTLPEAPPLCERLEIMYDYVREAFVWLGEIPALNFVRKHIAWFTQSLNGSDRLRSKVFATKDPVEIKSILHEYAQELLAGNYADEPAREDIETIFRSKISFWRELESDLIRG
jgi:nifR3 family TIM-barrel protein